jgi:hypothetical protein
MKIAIKTERPKLVKISSIAVGDVFEYSGDKFIKVADIVWNSCTDKNKPNAFDLKYRCLTSFGSGDTLVRRVDSTLHLEYAKE